MTQTAIRSRTRAQALRDYANADAAQRLGSSVHQWTKGDILIEQCGEPPLQHGGDRRSQAIEQTLKNFIDDTGSDDSYKTAASYRLVASVFSISARRLNVPWTTHRIFAFADVADPISTLQQFCELREHVDAERPGGVRYPSREAERFLGRAGTRQIAREDLVPEVTRALGAMTVEQRQGILRELVAQPEVLDPVVNDRDNGQYAGVSDAEVAFNRARGDYVFQQAQLFQAAREASREVIEQSRLNTPSLTNQIFLDHVDSRVRADWQRYETLAHDLSEPMLQRWTALLAHTRVHFQYLSEAVQHCIDALPDSPPPADDESIIDIDGEAREAIERFALGAPAGSDA